MTPETERAVLANLASLNELMSEMVAKVSDDPEFIAMARGVLRDHTHVGYEFQGTRGRSADELAEARPAMPELTEWCAACGRGDLIVWVSPDRQRFGHCMWCGHTSAVSG